MLGAALIRKKGTPRHDAMAETKCRDVNGYLAKVTGHAASRVDESNTEGFLLEATTAAHYDAADAVTAGAAVVAAAEAAIGWGCENRMMEEARRNKAG